MTEKEINIICKHFNKGKCFYGDKCKFIHMKQSIPCRYFLKKQNCIHVIHCKFSYSESHISKEHISETRNI